MCSTTAAASDAMKNSMGCGSPSSDMNARDCVFDREIFCAEGGASSPVGEVGATGNECQGLHFRKRTVGLLTRINCCLTDSFLASKFDVDEIDLEFLVGFDTNQKRRTTPRRDDFIGEMGRLEHKRERSLKLFEHGLDEIRESDPLIRLRIVNVFQKDRDGLRVCLGLEFVPSFLEHKSKFGRVSDDTIVDDHELGGGI